MARIWPRTNGFRSILTAIMLRSRGEVLMANPTVQYNWPFPSDLGSGSSSEAITVYAYSINVPVILPPFPGGNITLIAHDVVFADGAVLDVSGAAGQVPLQATSGDETVINGSGGVKGGLGQDGGAIHIYAQVITGTATLNANGGSGGQGGEGGNGAAGEAGASGQDGDNGGAAGGGGQGGDGGSGGTIVVQAGDVSGAALSISAAGGAGGVPGNAGQPGRGGAAGQQTGRWSQGGSDNPTQPQLTWIPGSPTHPGKTGSVEPSGGPGAIGAAGTATSTPDPAGLVSAIVGLLPASYWSMLLLYATQFYYDGSYTQAGNTLGWMNTIGSNGTPAVDASVSRARTLIAQMQSGFDVYGHPRNYVQALSVGTYETNNAALVDDGVGLETALNAELAQQVTAATQITDLQNSLHKAQSQAAKNGTDRANLITQGELLGEQLEALLTQQMAAMAVVNETSAELQEALSSGHGCTFSEIMSAVTLIISVAAAATGAGSVLSIAMAVASAAIKADQLADPPTLPGFQPVIKNINFIMSTVGAGGDPSNQLVTAYNNLKTSLGGKAPDPKDDGTKFVMTDTDFATVRTQFETKLKQLPESPERDNYEDAVNNYLDIVQLRNQQLLSFDGLAFKVASLDDSTSTLQDSITATNGDLNTLQGQEQALTTVVEDLTNVRNVLLKSAYFELLQQSRALDFWTLNPQDSTQEYDDFGGLQGILGGLITRKLDALQVFANPPATFSTATGGIIIPLSTSDRTVLAATGTYSFLISVDHPVFSNLAQVLANQVTLTFVGADGVAVQPIRLILEHSGYHKFKDVSGKIYEFLTPPRPVVQDTGGSIETNAQFSGTDTSLDPGNEAAAAYVGVSPFTRWKVTVTNDPGVYAALGNAKELSLNISGTARALVGSS